MRGTDYICLIDKDELNEILGQSYQYNPPQHSYTVTVTMKLRIHAFWGRNLWQGHIYQYFAQKVKACENGINYRIVYTYIHKHFSQKQ